MLAIACTAVKPPQRRGRGAGLDGLGVLAAGLAQVGVQVDQAGQRDQARRRRPPRRRLGQAAADLGDDAVVDQQVGGVAAEQLGRP